MENKIKENKIREFLERFLEESHLNDILGKIEINSVICDKLNCPPDEEIIVIGMNNNHNSVGSKFNYELYDDLEDFRYSDEAQEFFKRVFESFNENENLFIFENDDFSEIVCKERGEEFFRNTEYSGKRGFFAFSQNCYDLDIDEFSIECVSGREYDSEIYKNAPNFENYKSLYKALGQELNENELYEMVENAWECASFKDAYFYFDNALESLKDSGKLSQNDIENLNIVSRKGKDYYILPSVKINFLEGDLEGIAVLENPKKEVVNAVKEALIEAREAFFYDLYENIGQSVINDLCNRGVLENNEEIELEEFLEALKGFSLKNENDLKEFKEILSVKVESLKDDEAQKAEATFKRRRL